MRVRMKFTLSGNPLAESRAWQVGTSYYALSLSLSLSLALFLSVQRSTHTPLTLTHAHTHAHTHRWPGLSEAERLNSPSQ